MEDPNYPKLDLSYWTRSKIKGSLTFQKFSLSAVGITKGKQVIGSVEPWALLALAQKMCGIDNLE